MKIVTNVEDFYDHVTLDEDSTVVYRRFYEEKFIENVGTFWNFFSNRKPNEFKRAWIVALGIYPRIYKFCMLDDNSCHSLLTYMQIVKPWSHKFTEPFIVEEKPEIFRQIKAPIFFQHPIVKKPHVRSAINISILKTCPQAIGLLNLDPLAVYNDIESFISCQNIMEIPEQSNEGKIISHGFDVKDSFRKR